MNGLYENVIKLCLAFLAAEIIAYFFPEDRSLKWCTNIIAVYIFISTVIGFGGFKEVIDWNLGNDLDLKIKREDFYVSETEKILSEKVEGALSSVYVDTESVEALLKINEEGELYIDTLVIILENKSDIKRAEIVINELFKDSYGFDKEIIVNGVQ